MRPCGPALTSILCVLTLLACGCVDRGPEAGPPPQSAGPSTATREPLRERPAPAKAAEEYRLVGVVRSVESGEGRVTIRHEEIPGFMPAMSMPFRLKDRSVFEDLRVGDEVEGTLRVFKENGEVSEYELAGLAVTRPATAPPVSLTLRVGPDGSPTLAPPVPVLKLGEEVPDFAMTTQDGTPLRLSDLRGKVVVLTFIYTRCPLPEFCPLTDRKFGELASKLAAVPGRADKVRLLSVSFDPEHDTPEVLRRHARSRGAEPPLWTFAVAAHDELAGAAPAFGLKYGPVPGEIMHNLSTAVIDHRGRLLRLLAGEAAKTWTPGDLLKTIYSSILPGKE